MAPVDGNGLESYRSIRPLQGSGSGSAGAHQRRRMSLGWEANTFAARRTVARVWALSTRGSRLLGSIRRHGTHSMRRTKVALVYKRTGNLRACQLRLGHSKLESTVRYLGIELDDALVLSEQTDLLRRPRRPSGESPDWVGCRRCAPAGLRTFSCAPRAATDERVLGAAGRGPACVAVGSRSGVRWDALPNVRS